MTENITNDRAGEDYWSLVWKNTPLPESINTDDKKLSNHILRAFDKVFKSVLGKYDLKGKRIIEVGCGNSVWLPQFAKSYNLIPTGLDYSEFGCEQERKIFQRDGIIGDVYCADMFNPPEELIGKFDIVLSMGVVEHFDDTSEAIKALKKYIKPDGLIITTIPNNTGLLGWLQKVINKPIYDIHNIIDKNDLESAHLKNGFEIIFSRYVVSFGLHVNLDEKEKPVKNLKFKKIIVKGLSLITSVVWMFESMFFNLPVSKLFSPAVIIIAKGKDK
ncbi:MAG: class I SAM-dependent methyltransferase [Bacteroidetes bacterium]|jgi:2-polyprenyl-3-methyl-5-hydroxy-6-metoxy-1,4-benzoquinol methylase|nr:class I SAM-dependent methyltransferase [Bacteroidota bacterium]